MTLTLIRTSYACPEQYDVLNEKGEQVGYLRYRWGRFTASCPDALDSLVYNTQVDEEGWSGVFTTQERNYYLREAVTAIQKWLRIEQTGEYVLTDQWTENDSPNSD